MVSREFPNASARPLRDGLDERTSGVRRATRRPARAETVAPGARPARLDGPRDSPARAEAAPGVARRPEAGALSTDEVGSANERSREAPRGRRCSQVPSGAPRGDDDRAPAGDAPRRAERARSRSW